MRILISDKISDSAVSLLQQNGLAVDYQPEITPSDLLGLIKEYDGLIVRSRSKVVSDVIGKGVKLKMIGRVGSGVDNIDVISAKNRGIIVVNAPDANSQAVAEHTVGLMLSLLRKYPQAFASMKEGLWIKKELTGRELSGKTVGILGFGHIGKKVAKIMEAFGTKVFIFSRSHKTVEQNDLFSRSDIITVHLALNKETRGCITKHELSLMKPTAFLVNASRGEVIVEEDLLGVLSQNLIAGAALDVYWQEPLPADSPWRKLSNVILTPHIGASTKEALVRGSLCVAEDFIRYYKKEIPVNKI